MKVHNVKAKVVDVNGLYIIYEVDGEQYIDDSTFDELLCLENGDVVNIPEWRFKELSKIEDLKGGI